LKSPQGEICAGPTTFDIESLASFEAEAAFSCAFAGARTFATNFGFVGQFVANTPMPYSTPRSPTLYDTGPPALTGAATNTVSSATLIAAAIMVRIFISLSPSSVDGASTIVHAHVRG
jgi:hypothetical protein